MIAALNGHEDLVRVLVNHNADAGIKTAHGKTALDFARSFGHDSIVSLLKQPATSLADL